MIIIHFLCCLTGVNDFFLPVFSDDIILYGEPTLLNFHGNFKLVLSYC